MRRLNLPAFFGTFPIKARRSSGVSGASVPDGGQPLACRVMFRPSPRVLVPEKRGSCASSLFSSLWSTAHCRQAPEEVLVQALVPEAPVQALDEAVLDGLAGRNVAPRDAALLLPAQDRV